MVFEPVTVFRDIDGLHVSKKDLKDFEKELFKGRDEKWISVNGEHYNINPDANKCFWERTSPKKKIKFKNLDGKVKDTLISEYQRRIKLVEKKYAIYLNLIQQQEIDGSDESLSTMLSPIPLLLLRDLEANLHKRYDFFIKDKYLDEKPKKDRRKAPWTWKHTKGSVKSYADFLRKF